MSRLVQPHVRRTALGLPGTKRCPSARHAARSPHFAVGRINRALHRVQVMPGW
jgi:hypothetical protein